MRRLIYAPLCFCCVSAASFAQAPPPSNDNCADAMVISGAGVFTFENSDATTDGPVHLACSTLGGDEQITRDVWYCWTASCTTQALARTCGTTVVDTKIAVYDGCVCPPTDAKLLDCNDDRCSFQSMAAFDAISGHQYLIRVGSYPNESGGEGSLTVSCGPPNNPLCPGAGNCCSAHAGQGACSDEFCCETVCLCDPFCCNTEWDDACAGHGFNNSGCGAALLCSALCSGLCPPGSACPDDGLACTQDVCVNGICQHPPHPVGTPCGNQIPQGPCDRPDICDGDGSCTANFQPADTICRPPVGECDFPEFCPGTSVNCPPDASSDLCGACCTSAFECLNAVLPASCSGAFYAGVDCANANCDVIPAVSDWGLVVVALSLMALAKIVFTRDSTHQFE